MKASIAGLLRRNAVFVYLSFTVTGLTSIGPQRLFAALAPETAQAWVAGTLLVGTLASIAGVGLAGRYGLSRRPALVAVSMLLAMTAALFGSFAVQVVVVAAALQILARFLANYAKQDFDHRAVMIAGSEARIENDRIAVMMRFIGMLLGPLWFGAFRISSPAVLALVGALLALSFASMPGLSAIPDEVAERPRKPSPPRAGDRLFAGVAIGIYATYYLLASNIVYMLARVRDSENSSAFGGALITTVYGAAIATTVVFLRLKPKQIPLPWLLPAPLLMLVAAVALHSSWASANAVMVVSAIALGIGFAFYLLVVRDYVTHGARGQDPRWLAFFNNLANTSALLAFSVMAGLVALSWALRIPYATLFSAGLSGLSFLAIAGVVLLAAARVHQDLRQHEVDGHHGVR